MDLAFVCLPWPRCPALPVPPPPAATHVFRIISSVFGRREASGDSSLERTEGGPGHPQGWLKIPLVRRLPAPRLPAGPCVRPLAPPRTDSRGRHVATGTWTPLLAAGSRGGGLSGWGSWHPGGAARGSPGAVGTVAGGTVCFSLYIV